MKTSRNPQVDAYIEKSAEFAQPILRRLRDVFLAAGPELQEVIKWGVPHFEHRGLVAGMAAFKQHVSFGFWKSKLMSDPAGILTPEAGASMCNIKITKLSDLPSVAMLKAYIREAIKLNEEGVKAPARPRGKAAEVLVPADFKKALKTHRAAADHFESMSNSHRREYVEWIEEAKKPETRARRLAQALAQLAEGKSKNWKYERRPAAKSSKTAKPARATRRSAKR